MEGERGLRGLRRYLARRPVSERPTDNGSTEEVLVPRRQQEDSESSGKVKASDSCKAALAQGYTHIPNVSITRWVRTHSRPSKYWLIYLVLLSEWPLFLNIAMSFVHRQWAATRGYAMLWIGGFGLSVALMFVAAMTAWEFATERADLFDEMIKDSSEARRVPAWLDRFMAYRRQLILPVLGAISSPLYLYLVRGQLEHTVGIGFPSYLLISWVSFVGGNDVYWLWVATGLPKKIHSCGELKLRWQDPGSTPGLRLLTDSYGISALFLLCGLVSISFLGFVVPRLLTAHFILYTLYAFFVVVLFTSIRVAVVPFVWVGVIITKSKRASMAALDKQLPFSLDLGKHTDYGPIETLTAIYQNVSAAPTLPFSTAAMVQYGAAVAGSVVAFFFGLISSSH